MTTCEICNTPMSFQYDVTERETRFVLWECECGHKHLERRPTTEKKLVGSTNK